MASNNPNNTRGWWEVSLLTSPFYHKSLPSGRQLSEDHVGGQYLAFQPRYTFRPSSSWGSKNYSKSEFIFLLYPKNCPGECFFCFYGTILNLVTKVAQTFPNSDQFFFNMQTWKCHQYVKTIKNLLYFKKLPQIDHSMVNDHTMVNLWSLFQLWNIDHVYGMFFHIWNISCIKKLM